MKLLVEHSSEGMQCTEHGFGDSAAVLRCCSLDALEDSQLTGDIYSEGDNCSGMARKRVLTDLELKTDSSDADLINNPHSMIIIKRICSPAPAAPTDATCCFITGQENRSAMHDSASIEQTMQGSASPSLSAAATSATAAAAAEPSILAHGSGDETANAAPARNNGSKGIRLLLMVPRCNAACSDPSHAAKARSAVEHLRHISSNAQQCEGNARVPSVPVIRTELGTVTAAAAAALEVDASPLFTPSAAAAVAEAATTANLSTRRSCGKRASSSISSVVRKSKQRSSGGAGSSSGSSIGAVRGPRVRLGGKLLSPEEAEKHLKAVAAAAATAAAARAAAIDAGTPAATAAAASGNDVALPLSSAAAATDTPAAAMHGAMHVSAPKDSSPPSPDSQAAGSDADASDNAPDALLPSAGNALAAAAAAAAVVVAPALQQSPFVLQSASLLTGGSEPAAATATGLVVSGMHGSSASLSSYCALGYNSNHNASSNSLTGAVTIRQHSSSSSCGAFGHFGSYNSINSAATAAALSPTASNGVSMSAYACAGSSYDSVTCGSNGAAAAAAAAGGSLAAAVAEDEAAAGDYALQQMPSNWAPVAAAAAVPSLLNKQQQLQQPIWVPAFPAAPAAVPSVMVPSGWQQQQQRQPLLLSTQARIPATPQQQQQLMAMVDDLVQQRSAQAYQAGYLAATNAAAGKDVHCPGDNASAAAAAAGRGLDAQVASDAWSGFPESSGCIGWLEQQQQVSGVSTPMVVDDILPSMHELLTDFDAFDACAAL